jgi:predicted DNA-binding ribbon-helix-helix protein
LEIWARKIMTPIDPNETIVGATEPISQSLKTSTTAVVKRSVVLNGHKTSVSLENEFWQGLHEIAERQGTSIAQLVAQIDRGRDNCNLSSAIRVFVYTHSRGHVKSFQALGSSALGKNNC